MLGLTTERPDRGLHLVDQLASGDVVATDHRDDFVGAYDVVVNEAADEDGRDQAEQHADGNDQRVLLLLLAVPLRLLAATWRSRCRTHGRAATFVRGADPARGAAGWDWRSVLHECARGQASGALAPVSTVSRVASVLGASATGVPGASATGSGISATGSAVSPAGGVAT